MDKKSFITEGDGYWMSTYGRVFNIKDETHLVFMNRKYKIDESEPVTGEMKAINDGWSRIRTFGEEITVDTLNITLEFCHNLEGFIDRYFSKFSDIIIRGNGDTDYYKINYSEYENNNFSIWECIHHMNKIKQIQGRLRVLSGLTREQLDQLIDEGIIEEAYYSPSGSMELYDNRTGAWYNNSGQRLRNPNEYNPHSEGYTPFGDE